MVDSIIERSRKLFEIVKLCDDILDYKGIVLSEEKREFLEDVKEEASVWLYRTISKVKQGGK